MSLHFRFRTMGFPLALIAFALSFNPASAADWPQWLGPNRDGVTDERIADSWPADGPVTVWKRAVGSGFAGPAVKGDRLVLFHRRGDREVVECLSARDGTTQWLFDYPSGYRDDFGFDNGPRAVPTIHGDRVYTFGANGMAHCLNLADAKVIWENNLRTAFGASKGFFGFACSPLVEDGKVVIHVGGSGGAGIVALTADRGTVAWKATDDEAGYSSPVAATLGGERRAVCFTRTGLKVVDLDGGRVAGAFPWRSRTNASVNAAVPIVQGERIFISTSYNTGAALLDWDGGKLRVVWKGDNQLSNHYASSVLHDGFLYGFHGRQEFGPSLRCIRFESGEVRWSEEGAGAGTVLVAGGKLVVLFESGLLQIAEANPAGWNPGGRAQILGSSTRAYPALASGMLFARDTRQLVCVAVGPAPAQQPR